MCRCVIIAGSVGHPRPAPAIRGRGMAGDDAARVCAGGGAAPGARVARPPMSQAKPRNAPQSVWRTCAKACTTDALGLGHHQLPELGRIQGTRMRVRHRRFGGGVCAPRHCDLACAVCRWYDTRAAAVTMAGEVEGERAGSGFRGSCRGQWHGQGMAGAGPVATVKQYKRV